jgi:hypothetical protein
MPTDDWERGYAAGWRAAQRDDVRDISRDMGEAAPKKKRTRQKDPKLSRAMKQAQTKARKKNGKFKKGWNKSRMMKYAQALRRKM